MKKFTLDTWLRLKQNMRDWRLGLLTTDEYLRIKEMLMAAWNLRNV